VHGPGQKADVDGMGRNGVKTPFSFFIRFPAS